jgi:hypothetical protein
MYGKGTECNAGFGVLRSMAMKSRIFSDITPCSTAKANRSSEEHIA